MYKNKELEIINRLAHTIKYHVKNINEKKINYRNAVHDRTKSRLLDDIQESNDCINHSIKKLSEYFLR